MGQFDNKSGVEYLEHSEHQGGKEEGDEPTTNIALSTTVEGSETLYRVVKRSRPDCITKNREISPALFKDLGGNSVDRDGGREEAEAIRFIMEVTFLKRAKAIASLPAGSCFKVGARVEAAPSINNPFHANIMLDEDEKKEHIQALQLADSCKIVYFNDNVEWTG